MVVEGGSVEELGLVLGQDLVAALRDHLPQGAHVERGGGPLMVKHTFREAIHYFPKTEKQHTDTELHPNCRRTHR